MARTAMFEGLVVDEHGRLAEVDFVGEHACYVVFDEDFKRYVDAAQIDRQVLRFMREQMDDNRQQAVGALLEMMGKDDLFTKAAVESTIDHMEDAVGQPIPAEARQWLGMLGFRIVVDYHGDVVDIQLPSAAVEDDGGEE